MAANPHIAGRIEESRIDTRPVADNPSQEIGIATIATSPAQPEAGHGPR
jgi:hypothetical protein